MGEPSSRPRLEAVDALRGLVMVLMALDHARDYFGNILLAPEDLPNTTPALFVTRWVTHFCAPVFVFLAGTSAFLYGATGRTTGQLARFLWTRGLWLVVLELSVVAFGWTLSVSLRLIHFQVIGAIGLSMIVLAGLVRLGRPTTLAFGLLVVLGHDSLAGVDAADLGRLGTLWIFLFEQGPVPLGGGWRLVVLYPSLPWMGVMALGYAFGPLLELPREERRRRVARLGAGLCLAFVLLRASNLYGDPTPWTAQAETWRSVVAFLNCAKYPPSLCFLTMTLGPALLALAALDRERLPSGARWLLVYGRVPLFFYVLHLYALSVGSALLNWIEHGEFARLFPMLYSRIPPWYGRELWVAYLAWVAVVALLYGPSRWFGRVKRERRAAFLRYL